MMDVESGVIQLVDDENGLALIADSTTGGRVHMPLLWAELSKLLDYMTNVALIHAMDKVKTGQNDNPACL